MSNNVRLTEDMRRMIQRRIIEHAFSAKEEALKKQARALANDVYCDVYSVKDRAQMSALPAGFLSERGSITVTFEGQERWAVLYFGEERRIAAAHIGGSAKVYASTHKLAVRYRDDSVAWRAFNKERDARREEVSGILHGATTLKKLLETWPEIAAFCADFQPKAPTAIVKVPTDLNRDLGLPPKLKAVRQATGAAS